MRQWWRRLLPGLLVGLSLSLGTAFGLSACQATSELTTAEEVTPIAVQATELSDSADESSANAVATPLPPETAALIAQLAPAGLADPPRGDIRFVVLSDFNSAYGSTDYDPEVDQAIALLPFWQPDLVICGGDMVAGQKASLTPDQINAMWDAFDQHVAAPLRAQGVPFGFTMGNHDGSGALSGSGSFIFAQERDLATAYWNTPAHDPGVDFRDRADFPFYYSFSLDDIFVLVWDGSTNQIPADKLAWVEQELSSPAAQAAQLTILVGHLPLYAVAEGRNAPGEVMANADELRALLERHQVHTYISGHHHAYYPGHVGNLQTLQSGAIGSGPRAYIGQDQPTPKTLTVVDVHYDQPELTTYTTYNMATLQAIAMSELPRSLTGHNGTVFRRDVSPD